MAALLLLLLPSLGNGNGKATAALSVPSPHLISPHLTSSHLIASHLTSSHLISPHLTSSHLIASHLTSPVVFVAPELLCVSASPTGPYQSSGPGCTAAWLLNDTLRVPLLVGRAQTKNSHSEVTHRQLAPLPYVRYEKHCTSVYLVLVHCTVHCTAAVSQLSHFVHLKSPTRLQRNLLQSPLRREISNC